ncbi:tRNA (adenine(58)-N(1))-methyltransferase non-catalytic subunit TRM6 [Linepithema humile]|uniref:tRNA (adenine(58)-N(1))-methyltransferase non-catalytic subunit TRM6 n=1 Tax=Linepithema humile TaxID=83485 RepID=UPI0006238887|nr:PREDICTED: tRNA (adenine(58)-N(1))-methyltransferase non-catalytic subunit TRM6 [Linepithema humile]
MSSTPENTCESMEDVITAGTYVIIKKQNFSKLYKVSENGTMMLGKDKVDMREIIGKPFWSTFEIMSLQDSKGCYSLRLVEQTESWDDLKGDLSGQDNRFITDDGTSQKLSKEEILQLQEAGKSGKEIMGSLIENSTSFAAKTEYSQEKYIKKKERKYFRFLTVCKPSILSLHEVYFRQNQDKIGGLRMDALAQILSYSDVQSDGLHILYDSGSQGLPAAAMLNRIGANTSGYLINIHPGNMPQTTIVQAMNFPQELKDRHIAVNLYSFLRLHYQGETNIMDKISTSKKTNYIVKKSQNIEKNTIEESNSETNETSKIEAENMEHKDNETSKNEAEGHENNETSKIEAETMEHESNTEEKSNPSLNNTKKDTDTLKRKFDEIEEPEEEATLSKKPKWLLETQRAVELLNNSKARGLTIITREHPANIAAALLPFLGASRPFVIFHTYREPLQQTYMELKQKYNVINVRLFSNFLRSYQVLPDRTHPHILTSDTGGYILTGYLVEE